MRSTNIEKFTGGFLITLSDNGVDDEDPDNVAPTPRGRGMFKRIIRTQLSDTIDVVTAFMGGATSAGDN